MFDKKFLKEEFNMSWEELMSWDHFIKVTDFIEGLSIEEKELAKEAYRSLKNILGEDFLKDMMYRNHPLLMKISNRIPNARKWVIQFANTLEKIKTSPKFPKLIQNLIHHGDTTLTEIAIIGKFVSNDFNVKIYPDILINSKSKETDIVINLPIYLKDIFVEVTVLELPTIQKEVEEIWDKIDNTIRGVNFSLFITTVVYNKISNKHLQKILEKIKLIAHDVTSSQIFRFYSEENLLDVGISFSSQSQEYLDWCKTKRIEPNSYSEKFINIDERSRLQLKVNKKLEQVLQLPIDNPGILVIHSNNLFGILGSYKTYMTALQQMIAKYDNIIALILTTDFTSFKDSKTIEYHGNYFFLDNRYVLGGWTYLIWNNYSKFEVTKELKEQLIQTFKPTRYLY